MMSGKKTTTKVGAIVGVLLLFFVLTIFQLGKDSSFFESTYKLKVSLEKVDGLDVGGVVRLSGLRIGNVEEINFGNGHNNIVVTLNIEEKYKERLRQDSKAGLRTQGALGDKYIAISPGTSEFSILKEGSLIESEDESDLLTALSERGQEIEKVFDILNEIHIFTKSMNANNRNNILFKNLAEASQNLNDILKDAQGEDRENIRRTFQHLANIVEKVDNGDGTLGALVNDSSIHENIKSLLGGSKRDLYMQSLIQKTVREGKK